jgi:hypothetical protein
MPSAGFEPAIPAAERPQTYADRTTTGIGTYIYRLSEMFKVSFFYIDALSTYCLTKLPVVVTTIESVFHEKLELFKCCCFLIYINSFIECQVTCATCII